MQQRMEEQMRQQQAAASNNAPQAEKPSPATPAGEYIDFEEVK